MISCHKQIFWREDRSPSVHSNLSDISVSLFDQ
uniref:Uncharacterized protein n=1 Tax=Triatoma infestans TaxID=30076 RepID=A0A170XU89_TRIIF